LPLITNPVRFPFIDHAKTTVDSFVCYFCDIVSIHQVVGMICGKMIMNVEYGEMQRKRSWSILRRYPSTYMSEEIEENHYNLMKIVS
jgi:hypothetical protein